MIAYLSEGASKKIKDALLSEGFDLVLLPPFSALAKPVSSHADMLLCDCGDVIFAPENYNIGGNFEKINANLGDKYPSDIALNIAVVGDHIFANTKYASREILEHLDGQGKQIHHINQGYAHCSICVISESAIITADKEIARISRECGIDALEISSGHISLPPYDYGFIGGASGTSDTRIYFCGSLSHHPDGEKIRSFCQKHEKEVFELSDEPLFDIGGILFV